MKRTIFDIHDDILSHRTNRFPIGTWDQPDSREVLTKLIRRVALEKLRWDREDFCRNFCMQTIADYRLNGGFGILYKRNTFPFVQDAFPEWEIWPWELHKSRVPASYWTVETAAVATRWLVEERLVWDMEQVSKEISKKHFIRHHLGGMLQTLTIGPADAVMAAYPQEDWSHLVNRRGCRITPDQAREIRHLYVKGYGQRELARRFGCEPITVFCVVHGRTFRQTDE